MLAVWAAPAVWAVSLWWDAFGHETVNRLVCTDDDGKTVVDTEIEEPPEVTESAWTWVEDHHVQMISVPSHSCRFESYHHE